MPRAKSVRPAVRRMSVLERASRVAIERLEGRQLFSATLTSEISDSTGAPSTTGTIDLASHFNDPAVNSTVHFTTELGAFDMTLFDSIKPVTVANFLKYVEQGRYDTTIIHRSQALNGDAAAAPDIVQGGGYSPPNFDHIATDAPIVNEFTTNQVLHNTVRTVAMAKTSDPDSATSEFFVNLTDNSTALDDTSNSGGFTVFGEVTTGTYATVQAIAALPRYAFSGAFSSLPLRNYTQDDYTAKKTVGADNLVSVTATVDPKLTYSVTSSDPALVTPTITGGKLSLAYGASTGSAQITVTGTDGNGQSVQSVFNAEVGLQATLGTGGNKTVTYTDADGTVSTISYKGPGTAVVTFSGSSLTQVASKGKVVVSGTGTAISSIAITNDTTSSSISISSKGGDKAVNLGTLTASGALKSISAKNAVLSGPLTVGGAVGSITLASATAADISLGGVANGKGVTIGVGTLADTSITSAAPIRSLTTSGFSGTDSTADTITAPSAGSLTSKGDFAEDINVTGAIKSIKATGNLTGSIIALSVGSLTVTGSLAGSTVTLTAAFTKKGKALGALKVGGAITNTTIRASSSIGPVSADSFNTVTIYAGVTGSTLPATASEIPNVTTIASVKLKSGFVNSNIAGSSLGKLTLGLVQIDNGGIAFGIAADKIAAITGSTGPAVTFNLKKLNTPADFTAQSTGLNLMDAKIVLL